eukprot:scaffold3474_cov111-Isochrysis_galbana.AAC.3
MGRARRDRTDCGTTRDGVAGTSLHLLRTRPKHTNSGRRLPSQRSAACVRWLAVNLSHLARSMAESQASLLRQAPRPGSVGLHPRTPWSSAVWLLRQAPRPGSVGLHPRTPWSSAVWWWLCWAPRSVSLKE